MLSRAPIARAASGLALLLTLSGCNVLLPAHTRSNWRDGEEVSIELLTYEGMAAYRTDYEKALEISLDAARGQQWPRQRRPPLAAAAVPSLAPLVAGIAVDRVAAELRREATTYEAQFGSAIAGDEFWVCLPDANDKTKCAQDRGTEVLVQKYFGFRVRRTVASRCLPDQSFDAFELVAGIAPSRDQQMFRIAPLRFETKLAKAKVLSNEWAWWRAVPRLFSWIFRTPGSQVDSVVSVEIEGYWRTPKQELGVTKIGSMQWTFPAYDIATPRSVEGTPARASGWMVGVPVSYADGTTPVGLGTFTLAVTVTERDKSNAPQLLEQAAKFLSDQKPKIVEAVGGGGD